MLQRFLFKETNASTLCLFRILFGALMAYQMIYYFKLDYVFQFIAGPEYLFSYPLTPFFAALPEDVLSAIHFGLIISTVMIMLGFFYRYALIFFTLGFTYFSFVDKTLYNNHLYLMSLIAFVMIFMEANNRYGFQSSNKKTAPAWNLRLLQFFIVLVYFYGGLSKLSIDWLNGSIPTAMVEQESNRLLSFLSKDFSILLLTYGGIVFDLLIGFILLWKPTRWIGVVLVLGFNIINGTFLFDDIGVFPFFMICSTILFFDPERVDQLISRFIPSSEKTKKVKKKAKGISNSIVYNAVWTQRQKIITACLIFFVSFNLIWPFRSNLFTDNPEWTGHGSRFAWRMKMQTKEIETFKMTVMDGPNGKPTEINHRSFLSVNQMRHLVEDPFQIVQFAKYLRRKAIRKGMAKDPIIKATVMVKFNGRPAQLYIDPTVDLTKVDESPWADYDWIMKLQKRRD
ncbi:MAG: HTTM domain-containing protein [Saprospiraceae bacterium]